MRVLQGPNLYYTGGNRVPLVDELLITLQAIATNADIRTALSAPYLPGEAVSATPGPTAPVGTPSGAGRDAVPREGEVRSRIPSSHVGLVGLPLDECIGNLDLVLRIGLALTSV